MIEATITVQAIGKVNVAAKDDFDDEEEAAKLIEFNVVTYLPPEIADEFEALKFEAPEVSILALQEKFVVIASALGYRASRTNRIVRSTKAAQAWTKALFVMYIALMISSIIAFKMWAIRYYWNGMDRLAVTAHLGGLVILYLFPLFVSWFVVYKSRQYVTMKAVEKFEKHSNLVPDELKT